MKSSLTRARWAAIGAAVAVSLGGGAVMVANAGSPVGALFVPIEPCRLLDTRTGTQQTGIFDKKIGESTGGQLDRNDRVVIFDPSVDGDSTGDPNPSRFPADVLILGGCDGELDPAANPVAVVLNVTAVGATEGSFVTVYPFEEMTGVYADDRLVRPFVSHLNPYPDQTPMPNAVTVGLRPITQGDDDEDFTGVIGMSAFRVYNDQGTVDLIIDVVGYYEDEV
jgi:hypothetical protein